MRWTAWSWIALFLLVTVTPCEAADKVDPAEMERIVKNAVEKVKGEEKENLLVEEAAEEIPDGNVDEELGSSDGKDSDAGEEADEDSDPDLEQHFKALTSEQMRALHKKFDANSNGKVSMSEISDFAQYTRREVAKLELGKVMQKRDKNGDGKLNWAEYLGDLKKTTQKKQQRLAIQFRELDANSDRFVDIDELASEHFFHTNDKVEARLASIAFKDKDTNRDNVLSFEEFYVHLFPEDPEDHREPTQEDKDVWKKLDVDGSGTLSLQEYRPFESGQFQAEEVVKSLFKHFDQDKDNIVTADEMDDAKARIANDKDFNPAMYLDIWLDHHKDEL